MKNKGLKIVVGVLALALLGEVGLYFINANKKEEVVKEEVVIDTPTSEVSEEVIETYETSLFLTGDALLHGTVWMDADLGNGSYDFAKQLTYLKELSEGYDLKYYNQETILGGKELGLHGYPTFNSPQEFGDAMVDLGFNLVSTANNHCLDQGRIGIEKSLEYWRKQDNVHTAGTYLSWDEQKEIPVYESNGITYTFLSWTYGMNGLLPPEGQEYLVNCYDGRVDELVEQVKQAKAKSDVVIVAMHWGTEYSMEANDEQREIARKIVDAGAQIIIGNHPHVIQPIEHIGDAICFYAMGNMISAQDELVRWIGMVGGLKIQKEVKGDETTITLSDIHADLIYTYFYPQWKNFKVTPFYALTDEQVPNHQAIYDEFKQKITEYDDTITIGGFN